MINIKVDTVKFQKEMQNIIEYSLGFLDGVQKGKAELLKNIGPEIVEGLKQFVDSNARMSPQAMHHVYEWYQTGSPNARLFEIEYQATDSGLSFNSKFTQSNSIQKGSKVPFYNKAEIMENGVSVTITPRANKPLVFQDGAETVFTKAPVFINNPGGNAVAGSYQKVFDQFFSQYFSQSFLQASGILNHLNDATAFKSGFARANVGGRSLGVTAGHKWISKSKGGVLS